MTQVSNSGSRLRRRSSTRDSRPPAWWRTRWSAASSITSRTTGKRRSTPARACTRRARRWRAWSGAGGAELQPLFDAHREFVLSSQVLHADEPPVNMLDPGAGKTKRVYIWAYARGGFDALPGVAYDFCVS